MLLKQNISMLENKKYQKTTFKPLVKKWDLQNKMEVLILVSSPSQRLFRLTRVLFWNYGIEIKGFSFGSILFNVYLEMLWGALKGYIETKECLLLGQMFSWECIDLFLINPVNLAWEFLVIIFWFLLGCNNEFYVSFFDLFWILLGWNKEF